MIRCQNLPSDTNGVMLPGREFVEGYLLLSRSQLLIGDGDHLPSDRVQIGGPFIRLKIHALKNILEFDWRCHLSSSSIDRQTDRQTVDQHYLSYLRASGIIHV